MKANILISRIVRAVETEGSVGEGATLAEEYSSAVRRVNARMEAVQTAIDARQISDAVRLMEDEPRLLDEVSALDFNRLPEWEALCARNRWATPVKIDKSLLERVLMLNESTDAIEPFLRMYRKAVRTNNNLLAVQSLRRLAQLDHSQNWKANLTQVETSIQNQMVADFRAAKESGNNDEAERLARSFVETEWTEPLKSKGTEEIRAFVSELEARRRVAEGEENISILRRCMGECWNLQLAFSMLRAIDTLVEKGWTIPLSARDVVTACRKRCSEEMEAAEKDRRWKELCESLHAAIQREDVAGIRDALSSPEFLDREPDPELIKQARLVMEHDEADRRRKMTQIAVCAMLGLFAILGVSGWWLKQKLFNDRCEGEAVKLASLQKGAHAVDRLAESLKRLESEDPEVFADPRVNVFVGKLKTMQSQMLVRTNEVASILAELRTVQEGGWNKTIDAVTGRIERVSSLILADDDTYKAELLRLRASWSDHCEEMEAVARKEATSSHAAIVASVEDVVSRLKAEPLSDELKSMVAASREKISEWKRVHASHAPSLEVGMVAAEKSLAESESLQGNLFSAISKLNEARTASECLSARKALLDFYSTYPFVAEIGEHPVSAEEALAVVSGSTPEQKEFAERVSQGIDDAAFKSFVNDSVLSLNEIPSFFSLYGVYNRGGIKYFCLSKGTPKCRKPSYESKWQIDGELLDLRRGGTRSMTQTVLQGGDQPMLEVLKPTDEIKSVLDAAASPGLTLPRFHGELLRHISRHVSAAAAGNFIKEEVDDSEKQAYFAHGRYPAIRRVQLMQLYFSWLRDEMKVFPINDPAIRKWAEEADRLAQPVRVDNAPEDLAWTCLDEARVRQRNSDCARFLRRMANDGFVEKYKASCRAMREVHRMCSWQYKFVGVIAFNPLDPRWSKDHSVVIPKLASGIKHDHPLYVLRSENGNHVFVKMLVPNSSKNGWALASGEAKSISLQGDPLFQVEEDGKCIDAEATIREIVSKVPKSVAEACLQHVPLFN